MGSRPHSIELGDLDALDVALEWPLFSLKAPESPLDTELKNRLSEPVSIPKPPNEAIQCFQGRRSVQRGTSQLSSQLNTPSSPASSA